MVNSVKQTRPALVIGLGGTGQWILTYLKKDLLEYGNGSMPENIKLLAFDTVAQPQARERTFQANQQTSEAIRVGGIELRQNDEFIHLGRENPDMFPWGYGIVNEGKHDHVARWLPAEDLISALPRDSWVLSTGAGQIRQFGRLAVFNDLDDASNSAIWSRIGEEMARIRNNSNIDANNKLEVIICGSLAGGTGAGMFIDIGILLRAIASSRITGDNFVVRGFFILPGAFGSGSTDINTLRRQARAFAAWRELDRFMIKSPKSGVRAIQYHERHPQLRNINVASRPFDACYLVDNQRRNGENNLDTTDPENGVFPSVADVISAILDLTAGRHYTEHITANLAPIYASNRGTPLYSAVGTYTLKVPVYYIFEQFVHLFAREALDQWLQPVLDNRGEEVVKLASAKNLEIGEGKQGQEEAIPFLQRNRINRRDGQAGITATTFLNHIAEIAFQGGNDLDRFVQAYARPMGATRNLKIVSNLGDSATARNIQTTIDNILQQRFSDAVATSREVGDSPENAVPRIQNTADKFIRERFGIRLEDGTEVRGEYGNALGECRHFQVLNFREMLAIQTENILMGETASDPVVSRSGKLGYLMDFLNALVLHLDTYVNFLNQVDEVRQAGGQLQNVERNYNRALDQMRDLASKKMLFGAVTSPKAHKAQEDFVKAGQAKVDLRRDDLLLLVARETAIDIRNTVLEMRDNINQWYITLLKGAQDSSSLYQRVRDDLNYILVGLEREYDLERVQSILGDTDVQGMYSTDYEALSNMFERIEWQVFDDVSTQGRDEFRSFSVECRFNADTESISLSANTADLTAAYWVDSARQEYNHIPKQKKIGEVLVEVYGEQGAQNFASQVALRGEPLWRRMTGYQGSGESNNFVRVYYQSIDQDDPISTEANRFFRDLRTALGQQTGVTKLKVELVNSSDHYKMTLIRSDDLIPSDNFEAWHKLKQAYADYIQRERLLDRRVREARMLHNFSPEANAAEFEARYSLERQRSYEVFDPRVVSILSNKDYLTLFLLAFGAGFIQQNSRAGYADLILNNQESIRLMEGQREGSFDFFAVIDAFVNYGMDVRDGNEAPIPYEDLWEVVVEAAEQQFADHDNPYVAFLTAQLEGLPQATENTPSSRKDIAVYPFLKKLADQTEEARFYQLAEIAMFMFEDEIARSKTYGVGDGWT